MEHLETWHQWVNTGALAAFAVFVCWVAYRLIMHGGKTALELGERYVRSTEQLHGTLKEAEDTRSELCSRHAAGLETVSSSLEIGNTCLRRLVEMHEDPTGAVPEAIGVIKDNNQHLDRMKRAALRACQMCREVSKKEIPQSADEVDRHCAEIERIISES